jgi:error-prone DNA polymerase
MPDRPTYAKEPHPLDRRHGPAGRHARPLTHRGPRYAELRCRTHYSFLRGGSRPEELAEQAAKLGYAALAITDRNTLVGVARMHGAAKACDLPLIVGAEITPIDALPVTLYATDRAAYGRLCRIITQGRLRAIKGACRVTLADIQEWHQGLLAAIHSDALIHGAHTEPNTRPQYTGPCLESVGPYRDIFGDRLYLTVSVHGGPDDERSIGTMRRLAREMGIPLAATNDVHYHEPGRRFLQDVLTCIRERCTLEQAGQRLFANAERHLKPIDQMERLFTDCPEAIARTVEIAGRCRFSLDELRYEYPEALCPPDRSPHDYLTELTWAGARDRYPGGVPDKVRRLIEHELKLIRELDYEPYFLTVWDIVKFARSRNILCQGRGSAANSAVCYCLGITSVDPDRIDLLFERFVSAERNEPPDIDVDFEHERREEVFQYIYGKYGRDHAGIVAEVITYRPRSAVRDVGKALGLSLDHVDALAKRHDWWDKDVLPEDFVRETGLDPADRTVRMLRKLVRQILGFPRHLSQHVGGFVITRGPLCEMVPIENAAMPDRTFIEWDKDDIDALGILKIDCLALGMLTAIHKCFRMLQNGKGRRNEGTAGPPRPVALHEVPPEDPAVYDMICRADTVGVFQIESRAQMSMLPRLKPRSFYDLVIEVAIVRPGPIQGGMVHPYLRRRNGEEPITYPNEAIKEALRRTLGVPLFQEQAMRLAVVAAGFTPGEADQLRRAMGAWRRDGDITRFRTKLIDGMRANGLSEEYAKRCFEQISGFGEYGFPESHAASFALLVYVSAWLKRYHPAAFCASIINSLPMGFYQPAQLVRDAREHGVAVRAVDVSGSGYDCRLEKATTEGRSKHRQDPSCWGLGGPAVRLGMRLVKGVSRTQVEGIEQAQQQRPFTSVTDVAHRSGASYATLARLAAADAMRSLGLSRRAALWQVLALGAEPPMLEGREPDEPEATLPEQSLAERVRDDYDMVGLSLDAHPISLIRKQLSSLRAQPARALRHTRQGQWMSVAGLVLVRQRPGTAGGIVFGTLEDETGTANLIIRPQVYEKYRPVARGAVALLAQGRVERQGDVVHLQVSKLADLSKRLAELHSVSRDFH